MIPEISQEFKDKCKEHGIPLNEGFVFAILIAYKDQVPGLEQFLQEKEFWSYDKWQPYQINLCKTNEDLKPELKVDLFGGVSSDEFSDFLVQLTFRGISGKGHVNNEKEYSIFNADYNVDKQAFVKAKQTLGDIFSLLKCADVIANYYRTTEYASKFANYVGSSAFIMDYKSYQ